MKHPVYGIFTTFLLIPLLTIDAACAQARPAPQLTPAQTQQLSHDLVRSSSQDFFEQGQAQLEQEIRILHQRQSFWQEGILKISQDLQLQQDFSKFERPPGLSPAK